jgi:hypothetical protein
VTPERHQEIRDAIRALCTQFPDEYFRRIDEQHGYPDAFVDALIGAGWLAAMIPEAYGGAGLGLSAASVIMEEINRGGGNAGAVHGQMYNMGTLLRHGKRGAEARIPPAHRGRHVAHPGDGSCDFIAAYFGDSRDSNAASFGDSPSLLTRRMRNLLGEIEKPLCAKTLTASRPFAMPADIGSGGIGTKARRRTLASKASVP